MKMKLVSATLLEQKQVLGGNVFHGLKNSDPGFDGFGEVYFSWIAYGSIKAWKRHKKMVMNLIVPHGEVRFIFLDESGEIICDEVIGSRNYVRLTVQQGVWFGFQGLSSPESLVVNVGNIPHDPKEVERASIDKFRYKWAKL